MNQNYVLFGVPVAMLILGLVEIAKQSLNMDTKFAPLLSLALGVAAGFALQYEAYSNLHVPFDPVHATGIGVLLGLTASGVFSGVAKLATSRATPDSALLAGFAPLQSQTSQTITGSSGSVAPSPVEPTQLP